METKQKILIGRILTALFSLEEWMEIRISPDNLICAVAAGCEVSRKAALDNAKSYLDAYEGYQLEDEKK